MDYYLGETANKEVVICFSNTIYKENTLEYYYKEWFENNGLKFETMMLVPEDPFSSDTEGIVAVEKFDPSQTDDVCMADNINRAVFFLSELYDDRKRICEMIYLENIPEKKKELLEKNYYSDFQMFNTSHIVYKIINNAAVLGMVLEDFDVIDAHVFFELSDALANRYTVEDAYIGFSLWRLSGEKKHIKSTLRAVDNFVIQYMYPFADMPGARNILNPITTGKIYERLAIISSKFMVSSVAAEIVYTKASKSGVWNEELYANETDDNRIIQRTVSSYSLLIAKFLYGEKDEQFIKDRVFLSNLYKVLCKGNDVLLILCEIARIMDDFDENEKKRYLITSKDTRELYRIMLMMKDKYQECVFRNSKYFDEKRKKYDIRKLQADEYRLEELAKQALKYEQIIEKMKEANKKEIQEIVDDHLLLTSSFLKNDIDSLMQAKRQYLNKIKVFATDIQIRRLEEFVSQLKKKIEETVEIQDEYEKFYEYVTGDFSAYANKLLKYPTLFNSLVSAEYLYDRFIIKREEVDGFDYSCVSIMYYMALEEFINKLLYIPYRNNVLIKNKSDLFGSSKYLSRASSYMRGDDLKPLCELGPLAFLLKNISKTSEFKSFVQKEFAIKEDQISNIKSLGQRLLNNVQKRNDAAHGGMNITYSVARGDKGIVYPNDIDVARGLLREFLQLFLG